MDFILQFFVAYYDSMLKLVSEHKLIIKKYLCTWALVDFVASFPSEWVRMVVYSTQGGWRGLGQAGRPNFGGLVLGCIEKNKEDWIQPRTSLRKICKNVVLENVAVLRNSGFLENPRTSQVRLALSVSTDTTTDSTTVSTTKLFRSLLRLVELRVRMDFSNCLTFV